MTTRSTRYRAYQFINERAVNEYEFEAETDQAAIDVLKDGDNLDWTPASNPDADCDVTDEILALDRLSDDSSSTEAIILEDMALAAERPYGSPSRAFVKEVADLRTYQLGIDTNASKSDNAAATLDRLISEAKALVNGQAD